MLRKTIGATILTAVLVSSAAGQTQDSAPSKKQNQKFAATATKAKDGTDCQPQRAGVKCSRRKPRKPWFFGK